MNFGQPGVARDRLKAMFWMVPSFFQLVDSWTHHAGIAYVSIVFTYIWKMFSLACNGIGLQWWLTIGYKATLVRFALTVVSMLWRRNDSLLSMCASRYLTVGLHWIDVLLICCGEIFLSSLLPNLTTIWTCRIWEWVSSFWARDEWCLFGLGACLWLAACPCWSPRTWLYRLQKDLL